MPRAAPSFPAFDEWQKMSEGEQDALLDALEAAARLALHKASGCFGLRRFGRGCRRRAVDALVSDGGLRAD